LNLKKKVNDVKWAMPGTDIIVSYIVYSPEKQDQITLQQGMPVMDLLFFVRMIRRTEDDWNKSVWIGFRGNLEGAS
jgi:hypothetical protein